MFCSVGILASSVTANQIVAFIVAAFLCFVLFTGFDSLAGLPVWGAQALTVRQLGIVYHYDALSKGLIDSRDILYFFSAIFLMLSLTKLTLGSRQW